MDSKEPKLYSLKELFDSKETFNDSAYRRGFHHGLVYASEMLEYGKTLKDLDEYIDNDIPKWRWDQPTDKPINPPKDWT